MVALADHEDSEESQRVGVVQHSEVVQKRIGAVLGMVVDHDLGAEEARGGVARNLLEVAHGFVFGYIDPLAVVLGVPDDCTSVTTVGKILYELNMVLILISATIERQLWGKTGTGDLLKHR
jgi:hypothetical protein